MFQLAEQRLTRFFNANQQRLLKGGRIGLEKETLRVASDGHIAQTPHPAVLGSALTHPYITTDYSEALLEFITPPFSNPTQALQFLRDVHQFVYQQVNQEMLWVTSMPCVVAGECNIPIAWYGISNAGLMKHVYRRGLGYRYGRMMQVIAGVHFNYSLPEDFWPLFQEFEDNHQPLQIFRSNAYFALIRNLQRFGWLIPYLFGASPAVCKSFLAGKTTNLAEWDANTYYQPYATSLRISDIGYTNKSEKACGLAISYNNLDDYIASLTWAIETPCPPYEKLGVVINGDYRQLNANILQIENEYYSSMRPKQIPLEDEKPILALQRRGVQYVELRSLDVNAFDPTGIPEDTLRFLEAFLIFCLFHESPLIGDKERREIDDNQIATADHGRDPALHLHRNGKCIPLRTWAMDIMTVMEGFCEALDTGEESQSYKNALHHQKAAIAESELTPSARMLAEMHEHQESFFHFAKRLSEQHQNYFKTLPANAEREAFFLEAAKQSWQCQQDLETHDTLPFAEYLERYFSQR